MHWSIKYAMSVFNFSICLFFYLIFLFSWTHCGSKPVLSSTGDTWFPSLKELPIKLKIKIHIREKFLTKGRYVKVSENSSTILKNKMATYMPRIIPDTGNISAYSTLCIQGIYNPVGETEYKHVILL